MQITELHFNDSQGAQLGTPYEPTASRNGQPMSLMGNGSFGNGEQSNFKVGDSFSYDYGPGNARGVVSVSIGQSDSSPRFPNAFRSLMTGSGSSVFGVFSAEKEARRAFRRLCKEEGVQAYLVRSLS